MRRLRQTAIGLENRWYGFFVEFGSCPDRRNVGVRLDATKSCVEPFHLAKTEKAHVQYFRYAAAGFHVPYRPSRMPAMRKPWFRKQNKAWYFTNDDRSVVFLGHDLRGVRIMQREQLTSICCSSSAIANDDRNCIDIYLYRR